MVSVCAKQTDAQKMARARAGGRVGPGPGCAGGCSGRREYTPAPGAGEARGEGARPPRSLLARSRPQPLATNLWPEAGCSCAQLGMQMYSDFAAPARLLAAPTGRRSSTALLVLFRSPEEFTQGEGVLLPCQDSPASGPRQSILRTWVLFLSPMTCAPPNPPKVWAEGPPLAQTFLRPGWVRAAFLLRSGKEPQSRG